MTIKVFVGFDPAESVAYHVLAHSIMRHASRPVSITPLVLRQLPLNRPKEGSTEFTFSRFLVPWLCNYEGRAIYMDCDMLCRGDVRELWDNAGGVAVVRHDYTPKSGTKFRKNAQLYYARKNWSSVMVFDNMWCRNLTPNYVNTTPGLDLHQFKWYDDQIGSLPPEWNHLVGEYEPNRYAKLAHFTLGTPCFEAYKDCEFADEWQAELRLVNGAVEERG